MHVNSSTIEGVRQHTSCSTIEGVTEITSAQGSGLVQLLPPVGQYLLSLLQAVLGLKHLCTYVTFRYLASKRKIFSSKRFLITLHV